MKVSTKGRYALRMLLDLAQNQQEGYIALKDIAARQSISKKYLEQIVMALNQAGLLISNRGFQGGYRLSREAGQISLYDILKATEDSMAVVNCLAGPENTCPRRFECDTLAVWEGLNEVMERYMRSVTLQSILDDRAALQSDNYVI